VRARHAARDWSDSLCLFGNRRARSFAGPSVHQGSQYGRAFFCQAVFLAKSRKARAPSWAPCDARKDPEEMPTPGFVGDQWKNHSGSNVPQRPALISSPTYPLVRNIATPTAAKPSASRHPRRRPAAQRPRDGTFARSIACLGPLGRKNQRFGRLPAIARQLCCSSSSGSAIGRPGPSR